MNKLSILIPKCKSLELNSIIDYEKLKEYEITYHFVTNYGSTLTENETRLLLDEDLTPKDKPLSQSLLTKNIYKALKLNIEAANTKKPISTELIVQIQNLIIQNEIITPYKFSQSVRNNSEYILEYLIEKINERCLKAKSDVQKCILSFEVLFDFVASTSVDFGNDITGRMLMNYVQNILHIPTMIIYKGDQLRYIELLHETILVNEKNRFIDFMTELYNEYLTTEIIKYESTLGTNSDETKFKLLF